MHDLAKLELDAGKASGDEDCAELPGISEIAPGVQHSKRRKPVTTIRGDGHGQGDQQRQGDQHVLAHRQEHDKDQETKGLLAAGIRLNRFCSALDDQQLDAIMEALQFYRFQAGETIVRQGDTGHYFFVVHEGSCEVSVDGARVNTLGRGVAFGAIALLYNCPRTATVTAEKACGVWGVHGHVFRGVLQDCARRQHAENRRFLDGLRLFDGLSARQKERIGGLALLVERFEAGARVVTQGEAPTAMYVVRRGELSVVRDGRLGASGELGGGQRLALLGIGDCFGERAALDGRPHDATLVAEGACELVCVGLPQLREALGEEDLAVCLERSFLRGALRAVPVVSHLGVAQRQQIVQAMDIRQLQPGERVPSGLRLLIVLDGEVSSGGPGAEAGALHRGQWCQDTDLGQLQEESSRSPGSTSHLDDLAAGPDGCRLAVLTRESLAGALRDLGLSAIGGGEEQVIDYMRKVLLAKKVPVFHQLSEDQIDSVAKSLVLRKYKKGAQVFRKGEVGSAFFVIANGEVNVLLDGKCVRVLGQGACFGERALLFDEPRSATVEVTSDAAELWSLHQQTFRQVITESMRGELVHCIQMQDTTMTLKSLHHVRLIGAGAFGSVRLVEYRRTGQRYALKRVRKEDGCIPEEVQRECSLLAEIDHPFILRMVRTFETGRSIYILTELITGGQLYEEVTERMGLLSRKHAQFYVASLVIMIEALHLRSIAYRDLKPENVMLDSQGYLKLVDFGLAKKLDAGICRTYTVVGTPLYMAPEVIQGNGYGLEVDLWSLGVMFYEFVCGGVPFGDGLEDQHDVLVAVLQEELEFPPRYNDQAGKKLIQGLLHKQPESRLGAGINGWDDVKSTKFFKVGVSGNLFSKIVGRELAPPVVPQSEQYSNEKDLNATVSLSDAEELSQADNDREATLAVFRRFDADSDGRISRQELARVLQTLDPVTFTDSAVSRLLSVADTNRDGYISLEEFLRWISSEDSESVRNAMDLDIRS